MPYKRPDLTPKPVRAFEGVAEPRYLLAEIGELRDVARAAGLRTLDYLLELAAIKARSLAEQHEGGEPISTYRAKKL